MFLDDLQWADSATLTLVESLLTDTKSHCILLLGAYRDAEVGVVHSLRALLSRIRSIPRFSSLISLNNLNVADIVELLADMLQTAPVRTLPLAECLHAKTAGNPFYTLELISELHRRGLIRSDLAQGRWDWDLAGIQQMQASDNVVDFLTSRLQELPDTTVETLTRLAALGQSCSLGLLSAASGIACENLVEKLLPAVEQGMLITLDAQAFLEYFPKAPLAFCHDRMQQATYLLTPEAKRYELHLEMAERLERRDEAESRWAAAEHYAAAASIIADPDIGLRARQRFLWAARRARQTGAYSAAEHFLHLCQSLTPSASLWQQDPHFAFELHTELHTVLYCLARHDEADAVFKLLEQNTPSELALVDPGCLHIASLSNRTRYEEAIGLGRKLLQSLGQAFPDGALPQEGLLAAVEAELAAFNQHVARGALQHLPNSDLLQDERLISVSRLLNSIISAAFFTQPMLAFWVLLRSARGWFEEGYSRFFLYPMGCAMLPLIALREDHATGYRAAQMALQAGLARDGGVETARLQHVFGLFCAHWFEPLQSALPHAQSALQGLLHAGDMEAACFTYYTTQAALADTATSLDEIQQEIDAALACAGSMSNLHARQAYLSFRQWVRALKGQTRTPGSFDDETFTETDHITNIHENPMALCFYHLYRGLSASIFGDETTLVQHAEAAVPLATYITGFYPTALINVLHSLALLMRARQSEGESRAALMTQLACNQRWLADRAKDAPMNFGHLHDWLEAERLDMEGNAWSALQSFERAIRTANTAQRPWHHALIIERAAYFYQRHQAEHLSRPLLEQAVELYSRWGAHAKAKALQVAHPYLTNATRPGTETASELDHVALLRVPGLGTGNVAIKTGGACG